MINLALVYWWQSRQGSASSSRESCALRDEEAEEGYGEACGETCGEADSRAKTHRDRLIADLWSGVFGCLIEGEL